MQRRKSTRIKALHPHLRSDAAGIDIGARELVVGSPTHRPL